MLGVERFRSKGFASISEAGPLYGYVGAPIRSCSKCRSVLERAAERVDK